MSTSEIAIFELPPRKLSYLPTGAVRDVVGELGRLIADQVYACGETIPMEAELERQFSVSRTVIREAIKVLSAKGLLKTARRYGTRVCAFEDWHLLDPDVILWHGPNSPMTGRIFADSTELRCIFEPEAAALAAVNASPAQRETILKAALHIHPDEDRPKQMLAADFTFHATILEASGNVMLRQLQGLIYALLNFSYPTGSRMVPDEKVSRENHISVAKAINEGYASDARDRMRTMLEQNRTIAAKVLEEFSS